LSKLDKQAQRVGLRNPHGLRHAYIQRRYKELTGWEAPINGGPSVKDMTPEQYQKDHEARMTLSADLGHCRKQVTNSYLNLAVPKEEAASSELTAISTT